MYILCEDIVHIVTNYSVKAEQHFVLLDQLNLKYFFFIGWANSAANTDGTLKS